MESGTSAQPFEGDSGIDPTEIEAIKNNDDLPNPRS